MLLYPFILFVVSLPGSRTIGPGLSRFKSRLHPDSGPTSESWDSSVLPYTDEANSYAYWNCHTIPPNMTLCKSVGYSRMVLPNFLQHESLREVIQQANVWVALVNTDCHPDIQRFLCSLYAPVCLKSHQEAKIPPCWELCDQVRNACLPRMRLFGFDWPEIVQCKQFPRLAESMCIPPQETTAVKCAPCEQAITLENIASSYCMADVVLKASIQDVSPVNNRAALRLKLSPRTRALKIVRKDGTVTTSTEYRQMRRRSRQRRLRHRIMKSRIYRHLVPPWGGEDKNLPIETKNHGNTGLSPFSQIQYRSTRIGRSAFPWSYNRGLQRNNVKSGQNRTSVVTPWTNKRLQEQSSKDAENRRRRVRNSALHDLDGITELQLDCSACSSLMRQNAASEPAELNRKRWLVMGRRVVDEKAKQLTNQVQITFITVWDRSSVEFRRSMQAIRNQPVSHLCPKQQLTISRSPKLNQHTFVPARNLKILRSAPRELSDAPSTDTSNGAFSQSTDKQKQNNDLARPSVSTHLMRHIVPNEASTSQRNQVSGFSQQSVPVRDTNNDYYRHTQTTGPLPNRQASVGRLPNERLTVRSRTSTPSKVPSQLLETQMLYNRWMNRYNTNDGLTRRERKRHRRLERQRWRKMSQTNGASSVSSQPLTTGPTRPINPYGKERGASYAQRSWYH